jgi:hypothetical protein
VLGHSGVLYLAEGAAENFNAKCKMKIAKCRIKTAE